DSITIRHSIPIPRDPDDAGGAAGTTLGRSSPSAPFFPFRSGGDPPPFGRPFRWAVQTSLLEDAGFQPFVDHPSDNTVCDSSVEEFPEMAVVDRVEIFLDINIDTPSYSLTHE